MTESQDRHTTIFHRIWRWIAPRHFEASLLKRMTGFEIYANDERYAASLELASVLRAESGLPVRVIQAEWFEMGGSEWPLDDVTTGHVTLFHGGHFTRSALQIAVDEGLILTPTGIWRGNKFDLVTGNMSRPERVFQINNEGELVHDE